YGTTEYKRFSLVARGDRWLANLISYDRKKRDYEILLAIPSWTEQRIAKVAAERLAHSETLKAIHRAAYSLVFPLEEAYRRAEEKLQEADTQINSIRQEIRSASDYISEAADATDNDLYQIT